MERIERESSGAARRARLRGWVARYLPGELLGTASALGAAAATHAATGSLVAAAVAGTLGENVGYYLPVVIHDLRMRWRASAARAPLPRAVAALRATVLGIALEFGPAEVVDTAVVRPALLGVGPLVAGHPVLGWLAGKLVADAVFYTITILSAEVLRRRVMRAAGFQGRP